MAGWTNSRAGEREGDANGTSAACRRLWTILRWRTMTSVIVGRARQCANGSSRASAVRARLRT